MNCLKCGQKNPMTGGYCQRCGAKLDMTADEIRDSLVEKAKGEAQKSSEFYAKQFLWLGVIVLMLAFSLLWLSTGAPQESYYMPSNTQGAKYLEGEPKLDPQLPKPLIPLEPRKKGAK